MQSAVTFRGSVVSALVRNMEEADVLISGGNADSGGVVATVAISDLATPPVKKEQITAYGKTYRVISHFERNGVLYEITCGNLVTK